MPEGHVVVREGVGGDGAHRAQQLPERRARVARQAQGDGVEEVPEQPAHFPALSPGGGDGADHDLVLHRVAVEQGRERVAELLRQGEGPHDAAEGARGRTPPVGRPPEHGELAAELPPPVLHFPGQRRRQPFALPASEIRELDGELGQGRRPAGREGAIEGRELGGEDLVGGDPVEDDLVGDEVEAMLVLRHPHERRPQQRAPRHVERAARVLADAPGRLRLALGLRHAGEVDHAQADARRRRGDHLEEAPSIAAERRAPDLVAAHDLRERPLQRLLTEGTRHVDGDALVEEGRNAGHVALALQHLLLREGEGRGAAARAGHDPRHTVRGFPALAAEEAREEVAPRGRERHELSGHARRSRAGP